MQTQPKLRWDDLRVFLALHRHGSLKRGALELGVNISTMSRRLDALELAAGVHLFDRDSEGTRPTLAAEQLLPCAQAMEQAAIAFTRGVESLEIEPEGEVTLTGPPGLVNHFLAPMLAGLCDAYPRLRITVLSSINYADLTRREADIALRAVRPTTGDLIAKRVAVNPWCVLGSSAIAAAHRPLDDPNDLRWLTWGEELARLPDRQWIMTNVLPERIPLLSNSMTLQLDAARAGLGVMLTPLAYRELPGLEAIHCAPKLQRAIAQVPEGSLWLVGHRALRDVPRIAAVWSWLESGFSKFSGGSA